MLRNKVMFTVIPVVRPRMEKEVGGEAGKESWCTSLNLKYIQHELQLIRHSDINTVLNTGTATSSTRMVPRSLPVQGW